MKIIIATDGSEFSNAAIKECCHLFGEQKGLELKVVSVFEDEYVLAAEPFAVSAEYYAQMADIAKKKAESFAATAEVTVKDLIHNGNVVLTHEILNGPPDKMIVELAKEWGADLIVVGSHGRGFWGRMLGSVSDGVVHHAPCSVMVVRQR
jgi:nucleotide-binding universal stress UspA family protein